MKLRNKKTGEIKEFVLFDGNEMQSGLTLKDLEQEWEDYEEPKIKKYWWVSPLDCGVVEDDLKWNESEYDDKIDKFNVEIGNYFETKEEAEKAVEKLKAVKRLKDKGFRFNYWAYKMDEAKIENHTYFKIVGVCEDGVKFDDLDLLFCTEVEDE